MADGPGLHHHYRATLVAAGIAVFGLAAAVFAVVAPLAAAITGSAAGVLVLYAGGRWAARKAGIRGSGRKWRAPRPRSARAGGSPRSVHQPGRVKPATGFRFAKAGVTRPGSPQPSGVRGRWPLAGRRTAPATAGGRPPSGPASRSGHEPGRIRRLTGGMFGRPGQPAGRPRGRLAGRLLGRGRAGHDRNTPPAGGRPAGRSQGGRQNRPHEGPAVGVRRILSGPRKGQWRRYATPPPAPKPGRKYRSGTAGEAVVAPLFVAWKTARWAWRKTRRRRSQPPAAPEPAGLARPGKTTPAGVPVPSTAPEPTTQRPARPRLHDFQKGPNIMNHLDAAGEAASQHIGGWEPENASDLDLFLSGLPGYFDAVSTAFRTVAGRLADGYPVHPSIPERLREIASTIGGMADFSGEAHAAHRAQHDRELDRLENPRTNEAFWDVSRNQ